MYLELYSLFAKNSFHPSRWRTFSPWKFSLRLLSWESICLHITNLKLRVDRPESLILGNNSFNLYKNLIQFMWQCSCFSELNALNTWLRWWSCFGLFLSQSSSVGRFRIKHLSLFMFSMQFSLPVVGFLRSCGIPSPQILVTNGCFAISLREILLFWSIVRHFRTKSLRSSERFFKREMLFFMI